MIRVRFALFALSGLLAMAPPPAFSQPDGPPQRSSAGLPSDSELRLKQEIQSSFRVLPIQNGIILVPRSRRQGVDNVELREGMIAVNGTVVTGAELRQRLGQDADSILELSYLDVDTQRRVLLGAEAAPARPPASEPGAAPAPPAEPEASERASRRRPVEDDRRPFQRVSDGRVRIGGSITIDEDEEVRGPVVAVGGSVDINGRVRDNVVAVGGGVRLGPKAEVYGDVTSVGGGLSRDPAAFVRGQVNEVDLRFPNIRVRPIGPWGVHVEPWWNGGPWRGVRLLGTLVRMGLFGLLAAVMLLLVPRGVERIGTTVRAEPWKAAAVGFFAELLVLPLLGVTIVFLVISIIGIPLLVLVPFAIVAFFVALLLGFTGTASGLAHAARERFGWTAPGSFALLVVGLLFIWGLTMVGRIIGLGGGPFALIGGALILVGFLVEYAAWTVGLGGTILTRFGRTGRLYPPPLPPDEPPLPPDEPPPAPVEPPLA
jgi:hypothetical protein